MTTMIRLACVFVSSLALLTQPLPVHSFAGLAPQPTAGDTKPTPPQQQPVGVTTGVRFSLFPNVHRDRNDETDPDDLEVTPSLREVVRSSLAGLEEFGLDVSPDGAMTTCLLGPESALFEAVRVAFGRASRGPSNLPRQASMQLTFAAESLAADEPDAESPPPPPSPPPRTAESAKDKEFSLEAYILPPRVSCQFAVYPLGTANHKDIIRKVQQHARQNTSVWKEGDTHFCSVLEGSGFAVFDALRSCFAVAREESNGQDVVLTATLTGNKRQWMNDFFERTCND